jgi:hypothetical protein
MPKKEKNINNNLLVKDSMSAISGDDAARGKAVEYKIISDLLANGFDVFVPVVDRGVDLIIKDSEGGFVEIQVKSRLIVHPSDYFKIREFTPSHNFFIICHNIADDDFYVIPSKNFYEKSEKIIDDKIIYRRITYQVLLENDFIKNEEGLKLLKKALLDPKNRIG